MRSILTFAVSLMVLLATSVRADDNMAKINAMFANTKSTVYPAAVFTRPMPMAVGQWALYGLTDEDGERSIFRSAIIAHENDVWTIETTTINEDDIIMTQMSVKGLDKAWESKSVDDVEIVGIRIKSNDDEPMSIDAMVLSFTKGMYKKMLSGWSGASASGDGGDVTVPAGMFKGTTLVTSEVSIAGESDETKSWTHPSIPVYGTVKSIVDDEDKMELLDFGTSGATPSF